MAPERGRSARRPAASARAGRTRAAAEQARSRARAQRTPIQVQAAARATARGRRATAAPPARPGRGARPATAPDGYRRAGWTAPTCRPIASSGLAPPIRRSRVTPAGSVSSIGRRGPKAGCGRGRAMQRRHRHGRRVPERRREVRRHDEARGDAGIGVLRRRRRAGTGGATGTGRDSDLTANDAGRGRTIVRSSGVSGSSGAGGAANIAGIVDSVGWSDNGSISSVSGRSKSLAIGSRLVSPAGSSMGAGGMYGAGVEGAENVRCSADDGAAGRRRWELHRLDDGAPARLEVQDLPLVQLVVDRRPDQGRRRVVRRGGGGLGGIARLDGRPRATPARRGRCPPAGRRGPRQEWGSFASPPEFSL